MNNFFKFGETVAGYEVPVLNEREIRAAAGILFVLMLVSVMVVIFRWDFRLLKFATSIFLIDILVRVLINPRFSPTLILGRLIVRNQVPEYVGAAQKKFAWIIGIMLASAMFVQLVVLNLHSPINGLICMICLVFLFFETSFGICLGCKVYPWFYGKNARYCPGEVCEPQSKQAIQRITLAQVLVLVGFAGLIFLAVYGLHDHFSQKPALVLGMEAPAQTP
ncbi:MAG: DUF4395 domain-containing protein [Candidatus Firestonebacteria bacterium]|nr:DUF4395 domain-containing protein [Candidatus Firestonebacteria bacterium]